MSTRVVIFVHIRIESSHKNAPSWNNNNNGEIMLRTSVLLEHSHNFYPSRSY